MRNLFLFFLSLSLSMFCFNILYVMVESKHQSVFTPSVRRPLFLASLFPFDANSLHPLLPSISSQHHAIITQTPPRPIRSFHIYVPLSIEALYSRVSWFLPSLIPLPVSPPPSLSCFHLCDTFRRFNSLIYYYYLTTRPVFVVWYSIRRIPHPPSRRRRGVN